MLLHVLIIKWEKLFYSKAKLQENTQHIPGTDGQKMSKSKNNTINVFLPEKQLKKQIMGIKTDSTPLDEPKDPENCNIFKIYSLWPQKKI